MTLACPIRADATASGREVGAAASTWSAPRTQALLGGLLATLLAWSALVGQALASDDPMFKECRTCHEIGPGAHNKVGPHLNNLVGRSAAGLEGFAYSSAMRKAGAEGLVWDEASLDAYLAKPRAFLPGNRMSYRGMEDPADRARLIAWLVEVGVAQSEAGKARTEPAPAEGAPSAMADAVLALKGDVEYGAYLAQECLTCHQASGHADGIPSIVGLPRAHFVGALLEYRNNIRSNEVMKLMTSAMGNEEMAALAAYFGELQPD